MAVKSFKLPTTTEEEQAVTAGQRVVNLMWEKTQARIAVVTGHCNWFLLLKNKSYSHKYSDSLHG